MWRQRVAVWLLLMSVAVAGIGVDTAPAASSNGGGTIVVEGVSPGPTPSPENVTAEVRKNVTDLEADHSAPFRLSAGEEQVTGVRRLSVTAERRINESWITVAAVDRWSVETPPGDVVRLLYLDMGDPGAVSTVDLVLPIRQSGIATTPPDIYHRQGGEWLPTDSTRLAASREGDRIVLQVTVTGPGYVAILTEASTPTATTATTWPETSTLPQPHSVADSGLRTVIGVLALIGAAVLAIRGGHG